MNDALTWDATYAVAMALQASRPNTDLEDVSLEMIRDWTLALPDFDDDPELANDEVLLDIYTVWLEEKLNAEAD